MTLFSAILGVICKRRKYGMYETECLKMSNSTFQMLQTQQGHQIIQTANGQQLVVQSMPSGQHVQVRK